MAVKQRSSGRYNKTEQRITRAIISLPIFIFFFFITRWFNHNKIPMARYDAWIPMALSVLFIAASVFLYIWHRQRKKQNKADLICSPGFLLLPALTGTMIFSALWLTMPVDYWNYTVSVLYVAIIGIYLLYITAFAYDTDYKFFGTVALLFGICGYIVYMFHFGVTTEILLSRQPSKLLTFGIAYLLTAGAAGLLLYSTFRPLRMGGKTAISKGAWKSWVLIGINVLYLVALQTKLLYGKWLVIGFAIAMTIWYIFVLILRAFKLIK